MPAHTSSIVTLVNANGFQCGPFVFARIPALEQGSPEWPEVVRFCKTHKLDADEIFFEKDGQSKYYKEDYQMIETILRSSKPWEGHVFLTDKGNAFKPQGESIILDNGAEVHYTFDPPIHGKISINDGHLHPYAKAQWLTMRRDDDPEWKQLLQLAYCISTVPVKSTKRAWDRQFFLDREKSLAAVDDMLWGRGKATNEEREKRHVECVKAYKEFLGGGGVIDLTRPIDDDDSLQDGLNGSYWADE